MVGKSSLVLVMTAVVAAVILQRSDFQALAEWVWRGFGIGEGMGRGRGQGCGRRRGLCQKVPPGCFTFLLLSRAKYANKRIGGVAACGEHAAWSYLHLPREGQGEGEEGGGREGDACSPLPKAPAPNHLCELVVKCEYYFMVMDI